MNSSVRAAAIANSPRMFGGVCTNNRVGLAAHVALGDLEHRPRRAHGVARLVERHPHAAGCTRCGEGSVGELVELGVVGGELGHQRGELPVTSAERVGVVTDALDDLVEAH